MGSDLTQLDHTFDPQEMKDLLVFYSGTFWPYQKQFFWPGKGKNRKIRDF